MSVLLCFRRYQFTVSNQHFFKLRLAVVMWSLEEAPKVMLGNFTKEIDRGKIYTTFTTH